MRSQNILKHAVEPTSQISTEHQVQRQPRLPLSMRKSQIPNETNGVMLEFQKIVSPCFYPKT